MNNNNLINKTLSSLFTTTTSTYSQPLTTTEIFSASSIYPEEEEEDGMELNNVGGLQPVKGLLNIHDNDRVLLYLRYYARHFIPIFCLVGIIGNCMALLLIRTNYWLRRLTSNIYLCTLSVCGCLFLTTVFITWLDSSSTLLPLYSQSEVGCKILTFTAHSCDFICVWMISWVSCDRAIVLFRPGIRRRVCNKKFARNLVVCTVLFSSTLYGWCLVFAGLEIGTDNIPYCGINPAVQGYDLNQLHLFFLTMDTILCTVVPSLLIMIVNSLSIYRYRQCMKVYSSGVLRVRFLRVPHENNEEYQQQFKEVKKIEENQQNELNKIKKQSLFSNSTNSTIRAPPTQTGMLSGTAATNINYLNKASPNNSNCGSGGKLKSSDLTLSRSLLIVTSTFVLLNVPNYAFRLYDALFNVEQTHLWLLLYFITFLLYYLHHAVLFYMYIFWSPQMKKQLMPTALKLLECYCFKTVPEFGHHSQLSMQQAAKLQQNNI
ncbi:G_PROTEIN_RECEP_F1_2 domain-containing protein [Meloidogyne graminicola]|uniref:G_PROTEIN_RECEP_F1_2 domain-containing protein n=1 Tax=Meloidogyne graminicola TaxID=189291 RepID=A0A8S9ZTF0_9BILA|nr:G_PROTEIN_RECEP_F1_2 domain-containing protein [Meloidogyne graminicola]